MKPVGLLQPLPIPTRMWTDVSMDFIEGLPPSNGHTIIKVIVDRLTKHSHFVALKHPYTAVTVAKAFVANVARLHIIQHPLLATRTRCLLELFSEHYSSCKELSFG